ncbi:MAG: hypothetical protein HFG14_06825 [Lachnospiraceae bacterium]|jgi:2-keto-3-deoxy-6-phosphogluconate aldolase|nr:hypothetical protein [Lachnospiraceae bacterium]NBJ83666.1 hypothetical protein [bacterium 1XD42-76]NBK06979.1 hypothetical protein [bacterium 1XD42-94]
MKFAFLIMGNFDSKTDRAVIHDGKARIIGVANIEDAAQTAAELYENGIDCIELCGAFGEEGARKIIAATNNEIPVGYVTHLPEQDDIYKKAFAR